VAIADLTFIDQLLPALHLFPIAMLAGVAWACRRALGRRIGGSWAPVGP